LRRLQARIEGGPRDGRVLSEQGRVAIASALGVSAAAVAATAQRLSAVDQSLNASAEGVDGGIVEWQDRLADDRSDPEIVAMPKHDVRRRRTWLKAALNELSLRERQIINARWLAEMGETLESLGRRFGVSKERIRQLEARAIGKLRRSIAARIERPDDLFVSA